MNRIHIDNIIKLEKRLARMDHLGLLVIKAKLSMIELLVDQAIRKKENDRKRVE